MNTTKRTLGAALLVLAIAALAAAGCSKRKDGEGSGKTGEAGAAPSGGGIVQIDGSSTVFPLSQAVAEEYQRAGNGDVTVGVSGTGGGFKKFCRGEIDITGASRPIKPTESRAVQEGGIEYIELPVAYDGIAVVVHPDNDLGRPP